MALNNRIEDLHPDLVKVYAEAKATYHAADPNGPRVELNETHRSLAVQEAYYARGRKPVAEVQRLYKLAGLYAIGAAEAQQANTWVKPGTSKHSSLPARAFDVRMIDRATGKYVQGEHPYLVFAQHVKQAAAKLGVKVSSGAFWTKKKDFPHHELI
jgi:hypothetical protein